MAEPRTFVTTRATPLRSPLDTGSDADDPVARAFAAIGWPLSDDPNVYPHRTPVRRRD